MAPDWVRTVVFLNEGQAVEAQGLSAELKFLVRAQRSTKSRDPRGKMDILDCIGMRVLECAFGSSAVRKVEMLAVKWVFWIVLVCVFLVRCVMQSRDQ